MDFHYTTTNIIVEYKIEDNDKVFECEFTYDGHHTEEYDIIEEFYNRVINTTRLSNLEWFKIVNSGNEYNLTHDTFNERHSKLHWMVLCERQVSNYESELMDIYKDYIKAKKEYIKCSNE